MRPSPYRPSSGTEGMDFEEEFCLRCARWKDEGDGRGEGCEIRDRAGAYMVTDPGYPKEWVYGEDGYPCCTAFEGRGK